MFQVWISFQFPPSVPPLFPPPLLPSLSYSVLLALHCPCLLLLLFLPAWALCRSRGHPGLSEDWKCAGPFRAVHTFPALILHLLCLLSYIWTKSFALIPFLLLCLWDTQFLSTSHLLLILFLAVKFKLCCLFIYIHLQFILYIFTFNYQVDTDRCRLREKSQFRNFRSKVSLWAYLYGLVLITNQYRKA